MLNSIPHCFACTLMPQNQAVGIPYAPVLPKPDVRAVFVGRDPGPIGQRHTDLGPCSP
jgi:hypothetical protein